MGPKKILKTHSIWPEKIILMTLSRVGSDKGPDLEKIRDLMKISDKNKVYAAGGIRSLRDLNILRDLNVSGSLLATALGVLAAIPAVIAYNKFNRDSKKYSVRLENFSKRFISII